MHRTVLIAEDAGECNSTLAVALSGFLNLTVASARNGVDAWEQLQRDTAHSICALLTDLDMPLLDGFGLIAKVRAHPDYQNFPILVLSGSTEPGAAKRALRAGADAYFEKPYSPARVRDKLEQLLYEKNRAPA